MAILYGTTADGESLPVQVNEFGQLVAKGLPGDKGDQGDIGPEGPPGNTPFTTGEFSPVFSSSDESGTGFIEYNSQHGYWYRLGPTLTVQIMIRTDSAVLTDIRGNLEVSGIPPEAWFASPSVASTYGPFSFNYLNLSARGRFQYGRIRWVNSRSSFQIYAVYDGEWVTPLWQDLEGEASAGSMIAFTFSGLAADAVRSVPVDLDDLM